MNETSALVHFKVHVSSLVLLDEKVEYYTGSYIYNALLVWLAN